MILQPTVFVLGAGASFEAGFPLGSELASQIADEVDVPRSAQNDWQYEKIELMEIIARQFGNDKSAAIKAARQIRRGILHSHSIDDYINLHSNDQVVVKYGKLAIANCILRAEARSKIKLDNSGQLNDFAPLADTWYAKLFRIIGKDRQISDRRRFFENISFINFNYDRSLRLYLEHSVAALYNIEIQEAIEIVDSVNILHPYGSLGDLNSNFKDSVVHYGENFESNRRYSIMKSVDRINTYTEQSLDQALVKRIHNCMSEAKRVFFLGFGFHRQNVNVLNSEKVNFPSKYFATSLGISDSDISVIRSYFYNFVERPALDAAFREGIVFNKLTCSAFIDEYSRTMMS